MKSVRHFGKQLYLSKKGLETFPNLATDFIILIYETSAEYIVAVEGRRALQHYAKSYFI